MKKMLKMSGVPLTVAFVVVFALLQMSLLVKMKVYEPKYYLGVLEKEKFYKNTEELVNKNVNMLLKASNVPTELFSGVFDEDWIRKETGNYVGGMMNYMKGADEALPEIHTKELEEKVSRNADALKNNKNMVWQKKAAVEFVRGIGGFSNLDFIKSSEKVQMARGILNKLYSSFMPLAAASAVLMLLLAMIDYKIGSSFLSIGLIVAGLGAFVIGIVGMNLPIHKWVQINEKYYAFLISSIVKGMFRFMTMVGGAVALIPGLLCIARKKANKTE